MRDGKGGEDGRNSSFTASVVVCRFLRQMILKLQANVTFSGGDQKGNLKECVDHLSQAPAQRVSSAYWDEADAREIHHPDFIPCPRIHSPS